MITHLQKTWEIQNKVTYIIYVYYICIYVYYIIYIYYNYLLSKFRILVGASISNSQKLI